MVNSLLSGGDVPGLWGHDELAKELAPLEAARDADAVWRGPPGAAGLFAYFLHRLKVGGNRSCGNCCAFGEGRQAQHNCEEPQHSLEHAIKACPRTPLPLFGCAVEPPRRSLP